MQRGVEFVERDFFQDRFSEGELRSLIGDTAPTELFSWNSPSYDQRAPDGGDGSPDEPWLLQHHADELIVGSDKGALERAFP